MHWRPWLCERGSLTQKLRLACHNQLEVGLLRLTWAQPTRSEAKLLGIPQRQLALIREVHLLGAGVPWVFARSVIPARTLRGPDRRLLLLGNRSLGSLLFKDPAIRRGPLEVCRLQHQQNACWARRSVFQLSHGPLLVCEVFLPSMAEIPYPSLKIDKYV
jgi:chorismate--pyruvate lyase